MIYMGGSLSFIAGIVCGGVAIWLLLRRNDSEERRHLLHNNRALTARLSDMSQEIEELELQLELLEYAKSEMIEAMASANENQD